MHNSMIVLNTSNSSNSCSGTWGLNGSTKREKLGSFVFSCGSRLRNARNFTPKLLYYEQNCSKTCCIFTSEKGKQFQNCLCQSHLVDRQIMLRLTKVLEHDCNPGDGKGPGASQKHFLFSSRHRHKFLCQRGSRAPVWLQCFRGFKSYRSGLADFTLYKTLEN